MYNKVVSANVYLELPTSLLQFRDIIELSKCTTYEYNMYDGIARGFFV